MNRKNLDEKFKKFFQSIFRASIFCLAVTAFNATTTPPMENQVNNIIAFLDFSFEKNSTGVSACTYKERILEFSIIVYIIKTSRYYYKSSSACVMYLKIKMPISEDIISDYQKCFKRFWQRNYLLTSSFSF